MRPAHRRCMLGPDRIISDEGSTMDDVQFDSLIRQITAQLSRRTGLRLLTSLGVLVLLPSAAEDRKKKHKKKKKCTPHCAGKQCGADGCGGSCGTCGLGTVCLSVTC